jgi:2-dehydro-3-deoxyphosphogluconate aldolase / (4S)-4-hydroxy-2-oxoglutarate aldolase
VIGILRTNNRDVAFARGVELAKLGCKALEVTADSDDFPNLLRDLRAAVGDTCLVGAGTLMSAHDVEVAAAAGAQFAISPIHPDDGFVSSCHAHGMLAVPAAFTPQEIYRAVSAGAKMVKLFPAQMWSPANLKALKQIGSFGDVDIMPSGVSVLQPVGVGDLITRGFCHVPTHKVGFRLTLLQRGCQLGLRSWVWAPAWWVTMSASRTPLQTSLLCV